jgi:hypothetical protein
MYSPRIPDRLIPVLYRLARAQGKPMTTLVAEVLDAHLGALARAHALPSRTELRPAAARPARAGDRPRRPR